MNFDEDPLDLFKDDDDGVIETIVLLDDEEEKPVIERTGCGVLLFGVGASVVTGWWLANSYWT